MSLTHKKKISYNIHVMDMFKSYILQNWILILVLVAFFIILITTSFLDKKATRRTLILIGAVFILSITVFVEFYFEKDPNYITLRTILMAIRYSSTPLIVSLLIFALVKRAKWFVFIPAVALLIIDIVSIPTGIVFSINSENDLVRGPLGYLPFIVIGLYCVFLIYILIVHSNKRALEIIPIVFLAVALLTGVAFPFILGSDFSKIFVPIIGIALFIYYVFSILQLTKKDALTGLLNRQAYYIETTKFFKDITAVISIDMNGLKKINDTHGHDVGDEALVELSLCFARACKNKQSAYRIGGDEFVIVCYKTSEEEVLELIERIKKYVANTDYTCSIGYSYRKDGVLEIDDLVKESDEQMYLDKAEFYKRHNRRNGK